MNRRIHYIILLTLFFCVFTACASKRLRIIEVTAYCNCGECCKWERGSWNCLKLDLWNRYISAGPHSGEPYSGLTASGTRPHEPRPGLMSIDSIKHPWMIPIRIVLFPFLLLPREGTIAADTRYYPFGTRMYVPGWGYGVVEDRGSDIKGPGRLDIYYSSHSEALGWGRQRVNVTIYSD